MTSSANSLSSQSDECGKDEQRKCSQLNIQPHPSTENLPFGIAPQTTQFMMPRGQLDMGQNAVQAAYPFVDPYYGSILTAYHEGQPLIHPYYAGVQPGLPLPSDAVEEPVYVNAKQYRGILRRRQSRAKAESENKLIKNRKPYLHESRHLHALKRARGCGGRFLTAKDDEKKNENSSHDKAPMTHRQTHSSTSSSSNSACLENQTKSMSACETEHNGHRSGNSSSSS